MTLRPTLLAASIVMACQAQATTASYGWEDGATILGQFAAPHLQHDNSAEQKRSGEFALRVNDFDPIDNSTPQSFVGWVNGLSDGDTVTASFWVYDDDPERPAARIWGHYTDDATDIDAFAGSAGGNSAYTDGSGWQQVTHSWTFDSDGGTRDGLVIEMRLYDSASFTTGAIFLDDLEITASAGSITLPNGEVVGSQDTGGGDDTGGGAAGLFISEYVEGSSNNKAIELYNPGTTAIDLSAENIVLGRYSNGNTSPSNIALTGVVPAQGTYVIAHSSAVAAIQDVADQITGSISHNGDDAYVLTQNGTVLDSFGQVGNDPGSQWGSGDTGTQNNTLRRTSITSDTVIDDSFDPSVQWAGFGQDVFSDLGSFNGSSGGGDTGGGDTGGGDTGGATLVCGDSYTTINAIQGSGAATPLAGATVEVEAVVTADFQADLSGFYLQSLAADDDNNPATSEGIFVFVGNTAQTLAVGDHVRIAATAAEFRDMTQLSNVTGLEICSSGNALPQPQALQLPFAAADAPEAFEAMLVSFDNLQVNDVFNLSRFGSVTLSNGRRMIPTQVATPGAEALAVAAQNALNAITLDDGSNQQNPDSVPYPAPELSASNTLRVGDSASLNSGVLHYSFNEYRVQPLAPVSIVATNPRTPAPELSNVGNLKVGSFNVLNYFNTLNERGADTAEEFQRQKDKIVAALAALDSDVIGLMEVENDGFAADSSINDLVAALNVADPGSDWQYVTPEVAQIGTDAIMVGIIYRATVVTPTGAAKILDSSNSILGEDGQPLFLDTRNRPTLAQAFALNENGESFVLAVNHLKSKGSGCDAQGDPDLGDGQGNCNLTRTKAAQAVSAWLNAEYAEQPVLVVGDLNAYAKEDPLTALQTGGYVELFEHLGKADGAYSFVFRGESGQLDHALANSEMLGKVLDIVEWHINTDEPRALDYNTEFKSAAQIASFYAPDAYRSSDHDPVVVSVNLEVPVDPNLTPVALVNTQGLSEQDQSQFTSRQQGWEQRIATWQSRIVELTDEIAALDPETKKERIQSKEARIEQLNAKVDIYQNLVASLSVSLGQDSERMIDVARQVNLDDKRSERLLRKQARFDQRANSERAATLEARAAELMAQGKTERAERKLAKAGEARAKAQVFQSLATVLKAAL